MKSFYLTNLFYDWMIYVDGLDVIDSRSLEQYYAFSPSTIRQTQKRGIMGNVVLNDGKCSCSQAWIDLNQPVIFFYLRNQCNVNRLFYHQFQLIFIQDRTNISQNISQKQMHFSSQFCNSTSC